MSSAKGCLVGLGLNELMHEGDENLVTLSKV